MKRFTPVLLGSLSGALAFLALSLAQAAQLFSIPDIMADPEKFYGREVEVSGIVRSPRQTTRYVSAQRASVPVVSFLLYEPGSGKSAYGRHYISVALPSEQFRFMPQENSQMNVRGVLIGPTQVGTIDPYN